MLNHTDSSFFGFRTWYYLQFCIICEILKWKGNFCSEGNLRQDWNSILHTCRRIGGFGKKHQPQNRFPYCKTAL